MWTGGDHGYTATSSQGSDPQPSRRPFRRPGRPIGRLGPALFFVHFRRPGSPLFLGISVVVLFRRAHTSLWGFRERTTPSLIPASTSLFVLWTCVRGRRGSGCFGGGELFLGV